MNISAGSHNFVKFTIIKPNCQKHSGCVFASGKNAMYPQKSGCRGRKEFSFRPFFNYFPSMVFLQITKIFGSKMNGMHCINYLFYKDKFVYKNEANQNRQTNEH